ncbi:Hypothetical predicted protein, partial [Olea europaea subsp. europaea]
PPVSRSCGSTGSASVSARHGRRSQASGRAGGRARSSSSRRAISVCSWPFGGSVPSHTDDYAGEVPPHEPCELRVASCGPRTGGLIAVADSLLISSLTCRVAACPKVATRRARGPHDETCAPSANPIWRRQTNKLVPHRPARSQSLTGGSGTPREPAAVNLSANFFFFSPLARRLARPLVASWPGSAVSGYVTAGQGRAPIQMSLTPRQVPPYSRWLAGWLADGCQQRVVAAC